MFPISCLICSPAQFPCSEREGEGRRWGQEEGGSSPISHPLLSNPKHPFCLWSLQRSHRGFARSRCSDMAMELQQLAAFLCPYKYLHCRSCKSKFASTLLCVVNFGLSTSHHLCCCVFIKTSITLLCPAQWEAILFLIAFLKQTKTGKKMSEIPNQKSFMVWNKPH